MDRVSRRYRDIEIVDDPKAAASGMQAPLTDDPKITRINEVAINLRPYVN